MKRIFSNQTYLGKRWDLPKGDPVILSHRGPGFFPLRKQQVLALHVRLFRKGGGLESRA